MQVQLFTGTEAFKALTEEWDALVQNGITNTPFQYLAYQQAWWQHLQPSGAALYTVATYADNDLVAIGCFYLLDGILHFNGCVEETDYLDLIVTAEQAEPGWTAVFNHLISADFPNWQAIDLCNVPQDSPTRTILPKLVQEHGYTVQESVQEVCPVIELPETFDGYLANIDSKQRREVKRKLRRAKGAGVTLKMVQPNDDIAAAIDDFLVLLQQSTFEKRDWLNDGRRAVFHATAEAAQKAGTFQLLLIEVEGTKAAALFNFDYDGRIWVYNSGLNPRAFGNLSLGVVITALAIQKAVDNGRKIFDFLRGDETYKYRFGAKDTTVHRIQISK